jgi:dihydrofolate reductase/thymidylate synthase
MTLLNIKPFNKELNIVVAYTFGKQGIGKDGKVPWNIPEDMSHFKHITKPKENDKTTFSIVIMGRKTWDSIPEQFKPLANRYNVILSNDDNYRLEQNTIYDFGKILKTKENIPKHTGVFLTTWDNFINKDYINIENIINNDNDNLNSVYDSVNYINTFNYYVIGGEQIYKKALESNLNITLYTTEIYPVDKREIECDTFFPTLLNLNNTSNTNSITTITSVSPFQTSRFVDKNNNYYLYRFINYYIENKSTHNNHNMYNSYYLNNTFPFKTSENNYLSLMRNILYSGTSNDDRTGVGTLSIFGSMLKYDLRDTFPLCTTKRMFFRAIFEELMFYLSGKTDNKILQSKGIHVWDGNTSRDFLDKRGLSHYEEGDMGQTYGFNYRHFGGEYKGCAVDYGLETDNHFGYDQVANIIYLIKNEPSSRRIIIDLWDCSTIDKAALPSCLCKYQFNVNTVKKELNLAIYLRSSDFFLANNWNSTCGALFVHLLCNMEGIDLTPGELTVFIADAHLYKSHIEQVKLNLERQPLPFPKLLIKLINCEKKKNILEFKFDDLDLIGYKSYPNIKAEMAI